MKYTKSLSLKTTEEMWTELHQLFPSQGELSEVIRAMLMQLIQIRKESKENTKDETGSNSKNEQ